MASNRICITLSNDELVKLEEMKEKLGGRTNSDTLRGAFLGWYQSKIYTKYQGPGGNATGSTSKEQEMSPKQCCQLMLGKVQGDFCLWFSGKAIPSGGNELYVSATSRKTRLDNMPGSYKAYQDKSGDFVIEESTTPLEIFSKDEIRKKITVVDLGDRAH